MHEQQHIRLQTENALLPEQNLITGEQTKIKSAERGSKPMEVPSLCRTHIRTRQPYSEAQQIHSAESSFR